MNDFSHYLNSGQVWLYVPIAILMGALHGLEPGHSKTMMAAFIIAIRGTIAQAILLGVSAALSHSLIIWVLAAAALHYGDRWDAETVEPWLQIGSAVMILGLAFWMFLRTRREVCEAEAHAAHHHAEKAETPAKVEPQPLHEVALPSGLMSDRLAALAKKKRAAEASVMLDTGHGWLRIVISGESGNARFQIHPCRANGDAVPMPRSTRMVMETARLDGSVQTFQFEASPTHWESTAIVPEPREFSARLTMGHEDHAHTYRLRFVAPAAGSEVAPVVEQVQDPADDVYQDAHERAHAEDIERRFGNRAVTTPQIVLFGITGGLMPCPAAVAILLVCLQLKKVALGFAIVGAFSFGLAVTMVTVGVAAAWGAQHAQKRFSGFGELMRKGPYISCVLLVLLALYMAWSGWHHLSMPHAH